MASTKKKQTKLNLKMRELLSDAYGFVRGRQYNKTAANITYEELLDAAIDRIEGTKGRSDIRPTTLERIAKIKAGVGQAVDVVKKRPPHEWAIEQDGAVEEDDAANTPE